MNLQSINTKKKPIVIIDETLDFFNDKVLFPQKVELANEMLRTTGLPNFQKNDSVVEEIN